MKVLNPQYMGEITPKNEGNVGSHGLCCFQVFSAGSEHLAVLAYVPEEKQGDLNCEVRCVGRLVDGGDPLRRRLFLVAKSMGGWTIVFERLGLIFSRGEWFMYIYT